MIDFHQLISQGKATVGTQNTLRQLRKGKLAKVYVTANCPNEIRETIQRQAQAEIVNLDIPNRELGTLCKKPFSINLLGQLK